METVDRTGVIARGHLSGAKLLVTPAYFASGAAVIWIGGGERLERGDSFAEGGDGLGLVRIRSAADFHQVDRDGPLPFCARAVLAQQFFADGERFPVIR